MLNNFIIIISIIYFGVLLLLSIFFILVYFIIYKDYFLNCKTFIFLKRGISAFLQLSFVIIELQRKIIESKPFNIRAKLSRIHEVLFHEKVYSSLPKGSLYSASFSQRGYDAKSLHSKDLGSFVRGDITQLELYEFKKFSDKQQDFYNRVSHLYSDRSVNTDHSNTLQGFRPKGVKFIEVGFFEFKYFSKAESIIVKPKNINLIDFSKDFERLVLNKTTRSLHSDTILTKECLERLNIFIDSYTTGENKEFCELVLHLTSPGGSLHGLL